MTGNPLLNMMKQNIAGPLMNNPLFEALNIMKNGGSPAQFMNQMSQSNPQVRQAMDMVNGRNQTDIIGMTKEMARQRGIDLSEFTRQIGAPENIVKMFSD